MLAEPESTLRTSSIWPVRETSWPLPSCPNPSYQPLVPSRVLESTEYLLRAKECAHAHTHSRAHAHLYSSHAYMCMCVRAHTQYTKKDNVHWVTLKMHLLVLALACGRDLHLGVGSAAGHDASGLLGSQTLNAYWSGTVPGSRDREVSE